MNLALGIAANNQAAEVGLLDTDVYGPSLPKMMNLSGPVQLTKRKHDLFNILNGT